jgi:hypothetical protein
MTGSQSCLMSVFGTSNADPSSYTTTVFVGHLAHCAF